MKHFIVLVLSCFCLSASAQVFNDLPKEAKKSKSLVDPKKTSNISNLGASNIKSVDPLPSAETKGFYSAALYKNYEMMDLYLSKGADINCRNCGSDGRTALLNNVMTVDNSDPKFVKYLLDHGADANIPDPRGTTALMAAMAPNNGYFNTHRLVDIVTLLLKVDVKLESIDSEGKTAINYIEDTTTSRRLEMLIKAGANINNQIRKSGITLLMRAASNCAEQEYLEMLLRSGADISLKSFEGKSAVDYAMERATNSNSQRCNNTFKFLSNHQIQGSTKIKLPGG
jgi:ankyrin repeat protein